MIKSLNLIKNFNSNCEESQIIIPFFSVFNCVRKLREQRSGMVTSNVQYRYIYDYCFDWIKKNTK